MSKLNLSNITLCIIDCVDLMRARKALSICLYYADFGDIKHLTSIDSNLSYIIKIDPINYIQDYSIFMFYELETS